MKHLVEAFVTVPKGGSHVDEIMSTPYLKLKYNSDIQNAEEHMACLTLVGFRVLSIKVRDVRDDDDIVSQTVDRHGNMVIVDGKPVITEEEQSND